MTAIETLSTHDTDHAQLHTILHAQQAAFRAAPMPSLEQRLQALKALKGALLKNKQALCEALSRDYGRRSHQDTLIADILPCVAQLNYTRKHLKKWMKPSRRHSGLMLVPAKVEVIYQPLGVVGIIVPWNFPVMLSLGPLITALAAGNRAMIKLSEFTPATNQVLRKMLADLFTPEEVAVIEGEADVAAAFSALPFDHLLFTGSTQVGRHVMRAAADNLTPVTLELGGKSPALIAPDMPIPLAVERLIYGKSLNAGQICVAPDYVLVPEDKRDEFVAEYQQQFQAMYPKGVASEDYTSVVNARQYERLTRWLAEAEQQGATVLPCHPDARDDQGHRMITHLVLETRDNMQLMQEEIFGPLLPVIPYSDLETTLATLRRQPRPLAMYLMSFDTALQQQVKTTTHAGGMCINDTVFHVAADDAPFGGIGASGMGHYHGKEGFLTFSKAKTVLSRGKFSTGKLITPPYGGWLQKLMLAFFLR
ncbi:coniferyl aldehyde dehydrogenase [Photobacterium atrarenae]|uniref:Aldehyde dehydrogenase n=1 Tax=Photobacterium atrarenae TaxID=865757 RepID=A0ABY5GG73_9GAMM|nr:coniferyl aldehyde dehydrogenase [Photobacterium atrarenae]UTV27821.1 coniferyl aldehyde dehydrogenase [Photobacterium atrarenae]